MINISWGPYGDWNEQAIQKTSQSCSCNSIAFSSDDSSKDAYSSEWSLCGGWFFSDMIYNAMKILPTKSIKFKKEWKDP